MTFTSQLASPSLDDMPSLPGGAPGLYLHPDTPQKSCVCACMLQLSIVVRSAEPDAAVWSDCRYLCRVQHGLHMLVAAGFVLLCWVLHAGVTTTRLHSCLVGMYGAWGERGASNSQHPAPHLN
jgi:hypothetical protein